VPILKMKKLVSYLVMYSVLAGDLVIAFDLPERFKNYKTEGKIISKEIFSLGPSTLASLINYDIDNNGISDVKELFVLKSSLDGSPPVYSENPFMYSFDLNGDRKFGKGEVFIDREMDGWNGNEKIQQDKVLI